jgi:hypothetical protein
MVPVGLVSVLHVLSLVAAVIILGWLGWSAVEQWRQRSK